MEVEEGPPEIHMFAMADVAEANAQQEPHVP